MTKYKFYSSVYSLEDGKWAALGESPGERVTVVSNRINVANSVLAITWYDCDTLKHLVGYHDNWWPYLYELAEGWKSAARVVPERMHREILEQHVSPFRMGLT